MKKYFIITLPLLLGRACPVLRSGAGVGLLLLVFAYAMLLPACHKDPPDPPVPPPVVLPDTLPPLTTVGANTFGCYVNGKLWLPKADWKAYFDPSFSPIQSSISESGGGYLTARSSVEGVKHTFSFGLFDRKGLYYANFEGVSGPDEFDIWHLDYQKNKWYYPDDRGRNLNNKLEVCHLDTINNIISGKFQFTLYRGWSEKITDRKDSIVITDGRFDIRYHQ